MWKSERQTGCHRGGDTWRGCTWACLVAGWFRIQSSPGPCLFSEKLRKRVPLKTCTSAQCYWSPSFPRSASLPREHSVWSTHTGEITAWPRVSLTSFDPQHDLMGFSFSVASNQNQQQVPGFKERMNQFQSRDYPCLSLGLPISPLSVFFFFSSATVVFFLISHSPMPRRIRPIASQLWI